MPVEAIGICRAATFGPEAAAQTVDASKVATTSCPKLRLLGLKKWLESLRPKAGHPLPAVLVNSNSPEPSAGGRQAYRFYLRSALIASRVRRTSVAVPAT
jgi:hypothetical protein